MKKEAIILVIFILIISLVNAAPSDNEGTAEPDTSSPPITIIETFDAPAEYPEGLTYDGKYIWSTSIREEFIFKHDTETGKVIEKIPAPNGGTMDLAWDGKYFWNADYDLDQIYQLDTAGNIIKQFDSPGEQPMGLTWDGSYLWHTDYTLKQIYKMDTDGNIISQFDAPGKKPHGLAWDGKYLWNSDAITYNIYKLDTDGNVLEKYYFPYSYPTGLAIQGEFLWMAARDTTKIYKLKVPEPRELLGLSTGLANSPWPMFHGSQRHGGLSPYDTSLIDGTVKWRFEVPDVAPTSPEFESSPAIGADGTIYIGYAGNGLYAINPDGTEKWYFDAGEKVLDRWFDQSTYKGVISSPAVDKNGIIYFTSLSNFLFAVDSDGNEKWRFPIQRSTPVWSSPAIGGDGTIYVGAASFDVGDVNSDGLFAVNPDGTLKWKFHNPGDVVASPAIGDDGTIYVGAMNGEEMVGKLYAINPDGTEKWDFDTERFIESSPTVTKDTIYVGSGTEKLFALDLDGNEKWRFLTDVPEVFSTPAVGKDGTIYVATSGVSMDDNVFYAVNPDGTEKWRYKIKGGGEASAAIGADGTIYFGAGQPIPKEPNFFAFNPDGTVKWSYASIGGISGSAAIGKDGTVYIGTHNGGVVAFGGPGEGKPKETVTKPKVEEIIEMPCEDCQDKEGPGHFDTKQWNPEDEGIDCFKSQSSDIKEKCDMFCYDYPKECPDYFERKTDKQEAKKSFVSRIIDWFKGFFS